MRILLSLFLSFSFYISYGSAGKQEVLGKHLLETFENAVATKNETRALELFHQRFKYRTVYHDGNTFMTLGMYVSTWMKYPEGLMPTFRFESAHWEGRVLQIRWNYEERHTNVRMATHVQFLAKKIGEQFLFTSGHEVKSCSDMGKKD